MSTSRTPDAQDAYAAGQAAYGPSNGPKGARANNYVFENTTNHDDKPYNDAIRAAYIDGWDAAKEAAQPERVTYWQKELSNVITAGDNPKLKITGAINGTKWLSLTPAQFEALETFLLTIEETE